MLEPACVILEELIVSFLNSAFSYITPKPAMVGVITPQKSVNTINQGERFPLAGPVVTHLPVHLWPCDELIQVSCMQHYMVTHWA